MHQNNPYKDFIEVEDLPHDHSANRYDSSDGQKKQISKAPRDPEKNKNKIRFKELIDGTILVRDNMIRQLPFVIFLTFLGVIYIGNRFHAERMVRQINKLKIEVGDLRAEQITTTSELMNISRPSEVASLVEGKGLGLKESMEPPKKLKRK